MRRSLENGMVMLKDSSNILGQQLKQQAQKINKNPIKHFVLRTMTSKLLTEKRWKEQKVKGKGKEKERERKWWSCKRGRQKGEVIYAQPILNNYSTTKIHRVRPMYMGPIYGPHMWAPLNMFWNYGIVV
jgi:hypothetical protein